MIYLHQESNYIAAGLAAKANLCLNQAEIDLQQEEIARAIKNLERANSALSRLFGLEGEADD